MSGRIEEDEDDSVYFPEELEVFYENKCTKLGSGSFAKVLLAEHKGTKEMVAIKVMNKGRMKKKNSLHRFRSEVEALKTLIHQHICQLYQVYENEHIVSLVMEYCPGGELFDYIVSKKKLPVNVNYISLWRTRQERCFVKWLLLLPLLMKMATHIGI